jgi:hypothetical protein
MQERGRGIYREAEPHHEFALPGRIQVLFQEPDFLRDQEEIRFWVLPLLSCAMQHLFPLILCSMKVYLLGD